MVKTPRRGASVVPGSVREVVARPATQRKGGNAKKVAGKVLSTAARAGGIALGSALGMPIAGAAAGEGVGYIIDKIFGSGAYRVSSNSIAMGTAKATFSSSEAGIRITNREYVGTVTSGTIAGGAAATSFNVGALSLNPGNSGAFPWLSGIAKGNFTTYRWHGLVFQYIPSSGLAVAGTNPALGTVMGAVGYDPNGDAPTEKSEMLHYEHSFESTPDVEQVFPVECAVRETPLPLKFIAQNSPDGTYDPRLTDQGIFYLATQGQQLGSAMLGDLWVTYDVLLCEPKEDVATNAEGMYNANASPTRVFANASFDPAVTYTVQDGIVASNNLLTFNVPFEGLMMISYSAAASALNVSGITHTEGSVGAVITQVFEVAANAGVSAFFLRQQRGSTALFAFGAAPAAFVTRVYFCEFPYGTQYWPLVKAPANHDPQKHKKSPYKYKTFKGPSPLQTLQNQVDSLTTQLQDLSILRPASGRAPSEASNGWFKA